MQKVPFTIVAAHIGACVHLLRGANAFPLFERIKTSAGATIPAPDTVLTVDVTELDISTIVRLLAAAPQGLTARMSRDLRNALEAQIMAGIIAEGPELEVVLDDAGEPVTIVGAGGEMITATRPKVWGRIAQALTAQITQDDTAAAQMSAGGWKYLFTN